MNTIGVEFGGCKEEEGLHSIVVCKQEHMINNYEQSIFSLEEPALHKGVNSMSNFTNNASLFAAFACTLSNK